MRNFTAYTGLQEFVRCFRARAMTTEAHHLAKSIGFILTKARAILVSGLSAEEEIVWLLLRFSVPRI